MTLLKMLEKNSVNCGDCLELMKYIPDKAVDMILCDLPYGTTRNKWDTVIPLEPLWGQYNRIVKDNGIIVLTSQSPFDKILGASNINMFRYEWIWSKDQGTGHLNAKKMPLKSHENILVFYKHLPTYNPQMDGNEKRVVKRNGQRAKTSNYGTHIEIEKSEYIGRYPKSVIAFSKDKEKIHPTQKPVALFEYLIKTYTNEGDLVLDNCAGSGTTGVACINTNRNYILIEQEQKYIDIINKRIKEHKQL